METLQNITDKNQMNVYSDIIYNLCLKSYSEITGRFLTFSSKEEMIEQSWMWKIVRIKDEIVGGAIYKNKKERIAVFLNSTKEAKRKIKEII